MKYQVKGVMKESGQEVDITVEANDENHAVVLADAYGIQSPKLRLLDVPVPPQSSKSIRPAPPKTSSPDHLAKTLSRVSVVSGVLSLLVATLVFGTVAIVCGTIAAKRGKWLGWCGLGLGAVGVVTHMIAKLAAMLF